MTVATTRAPTREWPGYRAVWRWHFYAGLFCIPFVLWLSATGALYLFKPQVEAFIDRDVDALAINGGRASADALVAAALAAVPGARLASVELPPKANAAVRVLVEAREGGEKRVWRLYLHPQTAAVLRQVREDRRLMRVVSRLHGELMAGDRGSRVVELAASWAIVMIVSGLALWWPRDARLAGVLYPRRLKGRGFWRDLHAVVGFWVSAFALFLLVSGLPWTSSWGGNLKAVRQWSAGSEVRQDWNTRKAAPAEGAHRHDGPDAAATTHYAPGELDRVLATVGALRLAPPVLVTPPASPGAAWSARSDAQNRPRRTSLTLDREGRVLTRQDFAQRALLDRIVGVGVAAHEGQLFGWINQLLGLLTALGLILLSVSSVVMWWQRRPAAGLGAPIPLARPPLAWGFFVLLVVLGLLLPMLGASLLAVLAVERLLLRRLPAASGFLGLVRA